MQAENSQAELYLPAFFHDFENNTMNIGSIVPINKIKFGLLLQGQMEDYHRLYR